MFKRRVTVFDVFHPGQARGARRLRQLVYANGNAPSSNTADGQPGKSGISRGVFGSEGFVC